MNETLERINARYIAAFAGGPKLVTGAGNPFARVVLVGEAPGRHEVEQGIPFVGAAGKNLDEFLETAGLDRGALYVTNAVKFRPTRPGKTGPVNRPPTRGEVAGFRPWLAEELEAVDPRVVVTLGNTALLAVAGDGALTVGELHGRETALAARILFPLYHPASVIYNRALSAVYRADLESLRGLLVREGLAD